MNKNKAVIAIIILIIDQITKLLVQLFNINMDLIKGFLSFNYYQNTGAAWSILEGQRVFLIAISLVLLVLIYSIMYSFKTNKLNDLAFGLLIGGVLGNLIDRIFYGFVRDFIDVYISGYNFPVFNVADMAIVVGVVLMLISTIKGEDKNGNKGRRKLNKN